MSSPNPSKWTAIAGDWATSADLPGVRIPGSPFIGTIGLPPGRELLAATIAREQALLERGGLVLPPSPPSAEMAALRRQTSTGECGACTAGSTWLLRAHSSSHSSSACCRLAS